MWFFWTKHTNHGQLFFNIYVWFWVFTDINNISPVRHTEHSIDQIKYMVWMCALEHWTFTSKNPFIAIRVWLTARCLSRVNTTFSKSKTLSSHYHLLSLINKCVMVLQNWVKQWKTNTISHTQKPQW